MHSVIISLASNHRQQPNLSQARTALAQWLNSPVYTRETWTDPIGHHAAEGVRYLNQLVSARTALGADELVERLKAQEQAQGRTDDLRREGTVPIDLDLLQHGDRRYHHRDWQRPYVATLLDELHERAEQPHEREDQPRERAEQPCEDNA